MRPKRSKIIFKSFEKDKTDSPLLSQKPLNELDQIADRASKIIFQVNTKKFLSFSSNTLTICPNRVTVTLKTLTSKNEYPLLIESVTGAKVNHSFGVATLYIDTFGVQNPPDPIGGLRIDDARTARRYILALIECKKSNIDLSKYSIAELREKLLEIGRVREGNEPDSLRLG